MQNNSYPRAGQQETSTDLAHLNQICMDAGAVSDVLSRIGAEVNLVAPATSCPALPPGCGVAFSAIQLNPDPSMGDVYPVGGGKLGPHKTSLDRIGAALGVSWDADHSRRLDDRSHPWYCEYLVVGAYQRFDGSWAQVMDQKVMDLRDGSAQVAQIYRQTKEGKDPEATIEFMRANIASHCLTKARLRALRSVGLKTSYAPQEIERPFLVAKLVFTGQTDDPVLKPMYAAAVMMNMLAGSRMVFGQGGGDALAASMMVGGGAPAPRQMGAPPPPQHLPPAPPSNEPSMGRYQGQGGQGGSGRPVGGGNPPRPSGGDSGAGRGSSGPTVRFGRNKGTPLSELSKDELGWYRGKVQASIDDPERANFKNSNIRHMDEIKAEIRRRQAVAAERQSAPQPDASGGNQDQNPQTDDDPGDDVSGGNQDQNPQADDGAEQSQLPLDGNATTERR